MSRSWFRVVTLCLVILFSASAVQAGGWLQRTWRGTYRGVKKVGQELIEKPVRRLKGDRSPAEQQQVNPYPGDSETTPPTRTDVDIPRPVEDLSLDRPYDGKVTDYNRSSKIESILGMLSTIGELPVTMDREQQKSVLMTLDNRRLGHIYAGVLSLTDEKVLRHVSVSASADQRSGIRLSGGFVTYQVDSMSLRKVRTMFAADEDGRLFLAPEAIFPGEAESLWLQRLNRPVDNRMAGSVEVNLVRSRGVDGWLFTINQAMTRVGVSWCDGTGRILDCGIHALSTDRRGAVR